MDAVNRGLVLTDLEFLLMDLSMTAIPWLNYTFVITGSRVGFHDGIAVVQALQLVDQYFPGHMLMLNGAANKGIDPYASAVWEGMGNSVVYYPPDYAKWGRKAPLKRNVAMLEENPLFVLGFHAGNSPGTAYTIRKARAKKIPTIVFEETN